MSFLTGLTLVFVAAKLFGAVDWSWWLVFSPILFQIGIVVLILVLYLIAPKDSVASEFMRKHGQK